MAQFSMSTDRPNLWTGKMDVATQRSNSILSAHSLNMQLLCCVSTNECYKPVIQSGLPYRGKHWQGKTLANLANDHKFAKVSSAKIYACIKFVEQILALKSMKLKCACSTA